MLNRFWAFWTLTEQSLDITENSEHWLNRFWTLLKILNIEWTESEHYWKFWALTEQILNITENSEHILNIPNRVWTFWTLTEQILNILNIDWKFWTDSEPVMTHLRR
jgi:hypothetical protein